MGRVNTFLVIILVITVAFIIHLMAVSIFPEMDAALDAENGDTFNQQQNEDQMYDVLAVWVPIIMSGGVISWGFVREYQRQKDTALQVRRRPR